MAGMSPNENPELQPQVPDASRVQRRRLKANQQMLKKLMLMALVMFAFGYAMVPMYKAICEALGINVLAVSEMRDTLAAPKKDGHGQAVNTQVDATRSITVEFDANTQGPWSFKPEKRHVTVHPGEMVTVLYQFRNDQPRAMAAQAIPSYAPRQAMPYFKKLECFCFNQYELKAGESKTWPVTFVVDPGLPKDVSSITLSYTFFEVGGRTPAAPEGSVGVKASKP